MVTPPGFDGSRLRSWAQRAATELDRRRVEINELNVFPVPDADTGSNMAHTMLAAVTATEDLPADASASQVAEALAQGAIRGARGNSGVVLSQVIRGLAQAMVDETAGGVVVADSLAAAVRFADRAIADPVEGTVITVLRAAAVAAEEAVAQDVSGAPQINAVAQAATDAARTALANTPSQLAALREAGVVDAGGTGLVILLEALVDEVADPATTNSPHSAATRAPSTPAHDAQAGAGPGAGGALPPAADVLLGMHDDGGEGGVEKHGAPAHLEVMFYFAGDLDTLETQLSALGDSLIIARATDTEATVHIHSTRAGAVIEAAFAAGAVSDLRLEVLPAEPVTDTPGRTIIAVTPPGSLTELYTQAGATTVAPGEDVVAGILAAIRRSGAQEVILLPNGLLDSRNLAAVEKATRAFEQSITLLPTVRLVSGIAALTVHDAAQPLATAAFTMSEAAGEMRTAVAYRASKAGLIQGGPVGKGDIIVTAHRETVLIAETPEEALIGACTRLLAHGGEQVTVLYDPLVITAEHLASLDDALSVDVVVYPADGLGAVAEIGVE